MEHFRVTPLRDQAGDFAYVTRSQLESFHGLIWTAKFMKLLEGSTCPLVDGVGPAIYAEDYHRFADAIDKGVTTWWD